MKDSHPPPGQPFGDKADEKGPIKKNTRGRSHHLNGCFKTNTEVGKCSASAVQYSFPLAVVKNSLNPGFRGAGLSGGSEQSHIRQAHNYLIQGLKKKKKTLIRPPP